MVKLKTAKLYKLILLILIILSAIFNLEFKSLQEPNPQERVWARVDLKNRLTVKEGKIENQENSEKGIFCTSKIFNFRRNRLGYFQWNQKNDSKN